MQKIRPYAHRQYEHVISFMVECQVCLSPTNYEEDCIIECFLCNGKIHQSCYNPSYANDQKVEDVWYCQRCQHIKQSNFQIKMEELLCSFCPSPVGIMKKASYNKNNIWTHPQCYLRDYPIKFIKTKKVRDTRLLQIQTIRFNNDSIKKYWINRPQRTQRCKICQSNYGQTTKCKIPGCTFYFHITCGIKTGIVREQSSMNVKLNNEKFDFYIPFYCKQHLEARYEDFCQKIRSKNFPSRQTELLFIRQKIKYQLQCMAASANRKFQQVAFVYQDPEDSKQITISSFYIEYSQSHQPIESLKSEEILKNINFDMKQQL